MASDLLPWLPIVSSMPSPSFQIKLPSAIAFTSSNPSIFSSILLWNSYWYTNATLTHFCFHFIRLRGVLKFLSKELSVSNAKMQSWYQLKRILYHCQFLWADDQQLKLGTQVVWKCVQWYAVYAQSNFILSKRFVYKCKSTYLFGGLSHSLSYTLLLEVFYFSNKVVIYRNRSLWGHFGVSPSKVSGVVTSLAVRGTFGLADSTTAIFLPKDFNQSLRVSDSFRPMWCVRSLSAILNWMITSSLVARFRTKASLVPSVWILVSLSYRERKDLTAVLKSLRL